jgi:multicomponent Na+:H+ antiporter subunit E
MSAASVYVVLLLSATWIMLSEDISVQTIVSGIILSIICVYISSRLLADKKTVKIKLFRLTLYPFYLIGQVYLSAFYVIKLIIRGAEVNIIDVKTKISNNFFQTMLANSITLIPGTISLGITDNIITVLRLKEKNDEPCDPEAAGELIKGKIEKMLLKMEK